MKKLMMVTLALVGMSLCAIERTPEQIARIKAKRAAALAAKGGLVTKPISGNVVRIVSAQKTVDAGVIKQIAKDLNRGMNIGVEVSEMEAAGCAFETVEKALQIPKTAGVVLVVDDAKLPVLLSAPENAWSILNLKKLGEDFPPRDVYDVRVRKEVGRALAQAFGIGQSMNKPCLMDPVFSVSDLDKIKMPVLSPEAMSKVIDTAKLRGVSFIKTATYQQAVLEGWAPAPTNDVQKAIWDKAHQLPTAPIKIKPESQK